MRQVGFPAADEGLCAGNADLFAVHRYGEDFVALREGMRHECRGGGDVDLQRVDAQVGLAGQFGQPQSQSFQFQAAAGVGQVVQLLRGDEFQRVLGTGGTAGAAQVQALLGIGRAEPALLDQQA